jgi:excisionase family DNA binding protein
MATKNDNNQVLTVSDVSARWKCDRKTVYDAIRAGALGAFQPGNRHYRVTLEEVQRYEREHRATKRTRAA